MLFISVFVCWFINFLFYKIPNIQKQRKSYNEPLCTRHKTSTLIYKAILIFCAYVSFPTYLWPFLCHWYAFPLCFLLDYFKANLRISNIMSFHWRHFKCHVRNLLHLPWNSVLFVKLWQRKRPIPIFWWYIMKTVRTARLSSPASVRGTNYPQNGPESTCTPFTLETAYKGIWSAYKGTRASQAERMVWPASGQELTPGNLGSNRLNLTELLTSCTPFNQSPNCSDPRVFSFIR